MMESNVKLSGEPSAQALASGLATLGRYGDNYMVHAAEGETFVPKEILDANPALKTQLFDQMKAMGIENPNRYVVGDALNSINPVTGQPEFFFKKIFKAVKKVFKKVLPIAAPIIGNIIAPGIGGLVASGLTAKLQGGSWGDALKAAGLSYAGGALMQGIGNIGNTASGGFTGGLTRGLSSPFQAAQGLLGVGDNANPLKQGIFGGNYFEGKDLGTFKGVKDTLLPTYDKTGGASSNIRSFSGEKLENRLVGTDNSSLNKTVAPFKSDSTGIIPAVSDPSFLSKEGLKKFASSNLGGNLITGALVGGLTYITAPDPESDEEILAKLGPASAQRRAYEEFIAGRASNPNFPTTPEGQALLRASGITPTRTAEQLSRSTGVNLADAQNFQKRRYGIISAAGGGEIIGPGSGTSDSIPAMLSDGEFVMTAEAVRNAGNGDRDLGAARMYDMMNKFERAV
jgi:hypothetical protein